MSAPMDTCLPNLSNNRAKQNAGSGLREWTEHVFLQRDDSTPNF